MTPPNVPAGKPFPPRVEICTTYDESGDPIPMVYGSRVFEGWPNVQPTIYVSLPEVESLIQEWQTSTKLYRVSAWVERSDYYLAGHARATAKYEAEIESLKTRLALAQNAHEMADNATRYLAEECKQKIAALEAELRHEKRQVESKTYLLDEWEKDHAIANARNDTLQKENERLKALVGKAQAALEYVRGQFFGLGYEDPIEMIDQALSEKP